MLIGLISDTHMPRFAREVPEPLASGLRGAGVQQLLHAGDFTSAAAVTLLEAIAPLDGVAGNNDPVELAMRFGRRKIVMVDELRIGLVHGDGERGTTLDRALAAFDPTAVDVIMFGHSHIPYCKRHGRVWVVNPGSPCDKRRQPRYSYALLDTALGEPMLHYYDSWGRSTGGRACP